ncbi:hypothetical protein B0H14DRAFT_3864800, partial [Mycena olivaceomarginata]
MSSADFSLNNQDPDDVASGRSLRNCRPTATFGQYCRFLQWVGRRLVIIEMLFSDPSDRTIKGSMYKHPAIQAMTEATVFGDLLANAVQYPELFDDAPQPLDDDPAPNQPPRKPQFLAVAITVFISVVRALLEPPRPDPYPPAVLPCAQLPRVNHRKSTHETVQGHRRTHPLAEVMETFDFALNQSLF